MASGDVIFELLPQESLKHGSLGATRDFVEDASTPTMQIPVLDFDGSAQDEHAWWLAIVKFT